MHKVLLLDDKRFFHWLWMIGIRNQFHFLNAYNINQATEMLGANPDVAAIVVDGCVERWMLDTCDFIGEAKRCFDGPIIAAPCQWWHFKPMKKAGCTHHAWKWQVAAMLKKLLTPTEVK